MSSPPPPPPAPPPVSVAPPVESKAPDAETQGAAEGNKPVATDTRRKRRSKAATLLGGLSGSEGKSSLLGD